MRRERNVMKPQQLLIAGLLLLLSGCASPKSEVVFSPPPNPPTNPPTNPPMATAPTASESRPAENNPADRAIMLGVNLNHGLSLIDFGRLT